jgi:diguanylate cyclase (GGDEF)-like protein/PAS domain S-box-containing protein
MKTHLERVRFAGLVFEHTTNAIVVTDDQCKILAVNGAFCRITGYAESEAVGKMPAMLQSGRHQEEFYRQLWAVLGDIGSWQGVMWDRRKSGEPFPVWETITAIRDEHGKTSGYVAIFSDITELKQAEQRLADMAHHDPLTGLANRILFNDRLGSALAHARRHGSRVALLMLDLDNFKQVNDTCGHDTGDALLQEVALRLQADVREEDTVARLGGDEFAILFTSLKNDGDIALIAQKLVERIAQPINVLGRAMDVSTSIGVSIFPDDAEDDKGLFKAADVALYDVKARGRNAYAFYTNEMTVAARRVMLIDRRLRDALRDNAFVLLYQPRLALDSHSRKPDDLEEERTHHVDEFGTAPDLHGYQLHGLEVLLRWRAPDGSLHAPSSFLHVAEGSGLIEPIGNWVIDTMLCDLERWQQQGIAPRCMSLNLSCKQLWRKSFIDGFVTRVGTQKLNAVRFEVELAESALHEKHAVTALERLRAGGVSVAIDDFGTGSSCLQSLAHAPFDTLKIDRSFIGRLDVDLRARGLTSTMISMAHALGTKAVGVGVESSGQLQFLSENACDEAQGHYFAMPLDAKHCESLLQACRAPAN